MAARLVMSEQDAVAASGCRFIVAVSEGERAADLVQACCRMARACDGSWHAVHVETPESHRRGSRALAAEALSSAARLGGTVATIPAASVADGLISQIEEHGATDLVLRSPGGRNRLFRRQLTEQVAERCPNVILHLLPRYAGARGAVAKQYSGDRPRPGARAYIFALGLVAATALIAALLAYGFGPRGLDLFFLFPVIAAAVRFGPRPGIVAAIASVICHNLFMVRPLFSLEFSSQSLFMALGLLAVAIYTSIISERLRGRVRLSDRSATENAAIVTLAQELARAGTWDETARIVCDTLSILLDVRTALLRETAGALIVVASEPSGVSFGPVDAIARDCAWRDGEASGRGTEVMAAADWQFLPLKTGLGVLALVAIARDSGEAPVPADRAVLVATLVSLAALALERLRLEDLAVENATRRSPKARRNVKDAPRARPATI